MYIDIRLCNSIGKRYQPDIKKAVRGRLWMLKWWRRRESNPRPQALRLWLYMLIPSLI